MTDLYTQGHNPDVLTCLANLSNDEVFTPPVIANKMLDLLPQELFADPNSKFLDPAVKSGVFLREIVKRLNEGLKDKIPDLQTRIDHILHNQVFGIAITEMTSLLSRRSVYCSKYPNGKYSISRFDTAEGNIRYKRLRHVFKNGKCGYCGASEEQYNRDETLESHAYELIHTTKPEAIFSMKFDVIIGNPPYQLSDGGSGTGISAKPLYNLFVTQAKKLNPRFLVMIIPARWFAGGKGLDEFRDSMLNDGRIRQIVDYQSSKDCFDNVNIAGGVCYFLWERDNPGDCIVKNLYDGKEETLTRRLDEFDVFVRDNIAIEIIRCVMEKGDDVVTKHNFTRNPYGFTSKERGHQEYALNDITLVSSGGIGYVKKSEVSKNVDTIDKYKVTIGKVVPSNGEVDTTPKDGYKVITSLRVLEPNVIHTESYLLLAVFSNAEEAENFAHYMTLKLPRFLLKQTLTSMNISKANFAFVPFLDYSIKWTDDMLYERYELSDFQKEWIEYVMRPMDLSGGSDE